MRRFFMIAVTCVAALGAVAAGTVRPALAATTATTAMHSLTAVACPAAKDCVAVGGSQKAGKQQVPFASRWNGSKWAALAVPLPAGATSGQLLAMSCPSPKFCLALGYYQVKSGAPVLAETWNGTKWKLVTAPAPAGLSPTVTGVSCVSATSCLAAGHTYPASGGTLPFTAHWTGAKWSSVKLALPKGATGASTAGVSCVSATWCQVGVNSFVSKNFAAIDQAAYIYTWNGKTWASAKLAFGASTLLPTVDDIVCRSSRDCVALGQTLPVAGWQTEVATFNGKAWTVKTLAGSKVLMSAIACPAAKSCLAAGSQGSNAYGQNAKAYAESWNGTAWKGAAAPAPKGPSVMLSDVACASAGYCLAVGDAIPGNGTVTSFADLWTGKAWKLAPAP